MQFCFEKVYDLYRTLPCASALACDNQLTVAYDGSYCPSSCFSAVCRQIVRIVVQQEAVVTGHLNDCTVCRVAVALRPVDDVERWTYASWENMRTIARVSLI